jgi:hypothetical protein
MIQILIQYVLLALGLMASLLLFLSVKREIRNSQRRMEQMAAELGEKAAQEAPVFAPSPARSGMNLNKRVLAIRLLRRGEDVAHTAAALGVPRSEVELLVRVQQFVAATAATVPSESR